MLVDANPFKKNEPKWVLKGGTARFVTQHVMCDRREFGAPALVYSRAIIHQWPDQSADTAPSSSNAGSARHLW
jgi:hypothetical protein